MSDYSTLVLECLSEGIAAFNGDRRAVMVNPALISLLGWHEQPVLGRRPEELLSDRPELLRVIRDGFSGRRQKAPTELVQQGPEGAIQHLRVTTSFLADGPEHGVVMVVRDVSELKRMEWEIFQVEKMSALGRLAASVAHEVRNPLGAIDIQLQLLEDDLAEVSAGLREGLYRRLSIAQTEMKRLDRIVQNFLRFSRTPKLRLQRLALNDVVRHVFELVSPEAREREIRLTLDLAPNLPYVDGDEDHLGQAILNLVVNAFQSIEGEGEVRAVTYADPGQVYLVLADTGCGIPEAEIDRIFEFYYTTKDEGTGLGLSIAQRIIYQHGGRIEAEGKEGVGATFKICLPVAMEGAG